MATKISTGKTLLSAKSKNLVPSSGKKVPVSKLGTGNKSHSTNRKLSPAVGKSPLVKVSEDFRKKIDRLQFSSPVALQYNPLDYAWAPFKQYLEQFGRGKKKAIFLGMNPGPWGMAQTGIPFGEVRIVKEWLGIETRVNKPANEHPSRPIVGFETTRSEVSGARLWGFFKNHFEKPEAFFKNHFVLNYCPLIFFDDKLRNLTPDKLKKAETQELFETCDSYLRAVQEELEADYWVGVGAFAAQRARAAFGIDTKSLKANETNSAQNRKVAGQLNRDLVPEVLSILHPSPASPLANRGWAEAASKQLHQHGLGF